MVQKIPSFFFQELQLITVLFLIFDSYMSSGFYPSTFVYGCFPPKIQFLYCLLNSVAPWGGLMIDSEGKFFEIQICRFLENTFFLDFCWNFRVLWGVLKKMLLERCMQLSFMRVCKYLNQRVRKKSEQNGKYFKIVSKAKTKKIT